MKASPPLALPFAAATVVGSVMIAVSVLVLPGETGGRRATTPPSTPPSAVSAVSAAPDRLASLPPGVELIVASGPDLSQGARRKAIDAWNQLHPGIQARIVAVEGNTDRQRDRFHALLDPANADVVDIVNVDSVHLPEFANTSSTGATGLLAPIGAGDTDVVGAITEDHLRDFLPNALLTCYWQEKLYGLPFNTDVGLLFFHAGTAPAPSWNELPGALAKNPAVPARLALQLGRDEAFVVNVLEQLLAVTATC